RPGARHAITNTRATIRLLPRPPSGRPRARPYYHWYGAARRRRPHSQQNRSVARFCGAKCHVRTALAQKPALTVAAGLWYPNFEVDGGGSALDSHTDQALYPPARTDQSATADELRSGRPLRILFVAPYVPSALRPRPFHFIRCLGILGHRVTVIAAATTPRELAD